ncbi:hypothetical protein ACFL54_01525 [Planctomycetota bacterium]
MPIKNNHFMIYLLTIILPTVMVLFFTGTANPADEEEVKTSRYNPQTDGLVVHEWGVISCAKTPSATAGHPRIPAFVKMGRFQPAPYLPPEDEPAAADKPVIYFYSPKEQAIKVEVKIPSRCDTIYHWVPGRASIKGADSSWVSVEWNNLKISGPEDKGEISPVDDCHWWNTARNTAANFLEVAGRKLSFREKFLFYEVTGLPFSKPCYIQWDQDSCKIQLATCREFSVEDQSDAAPDPESDKSIRRVPKPRFLETKLHDVFALRIFQGKGTVVFTGKIDLSKKDERQIQMDPEVTMNLRSKTWRSATEGRLKKVLAKAGLYGDEIKSMTQIWNDDFFQKDGLRIIYRMSGKKYDELFPLNISEKAESIKRVMLVTIEG